MLIERWIALRRNLLLFGSLIALSALLVAQLPIAHAQQSNPTVRDIQSNPNAYYDRIVTINGVLDLYVDANEFLLNDGTGQIVVDSGPPWYLNINIPTGTSLSVTGQIDFMRNGGVDLDACQIVTPSETINIRDCSFIGPPPWAGGPNRGRGGGAGRNSDDDFYGFIEARPSGTAGTWVISGRSFTASNSTRLDTDDGPLSVGTCVSVEYEGTQAFEIESEPQRKCR